MTNSPDIGEDDQLTNDMEVINDIVIELVGVGASILAITPYKTTVEGNITTVRDANYDIVATIEESNKLGNPTIRTLYGKVQLMPGENDVIAAARTLSYKDGRHEGQTSYGNDLERKIWHPLGSQRGLLPALTRLHVSNLRVN